LTLASGTKLGSHEVVAQIGAGGMGEVYEAEDLELHRHVAMNSFKKLKRKVPTGKN
jgi:serine/threonine protein kinase